MEPTFWLFASPGLIILGVVLWWDWRQRRFRPLGKAAPMWLASRAEAVAFRQLEQRYPPDRFIISAHVLLIDVLGRDRVGALRSWERDFAFRAHCDFVIADRKSLAILAVVEVGGPGHDRESQRRRDRMKDALLARAKVPVTRMAGGYSGPALARPSL